jgi:hypothetical protein
MTDTDQKALDRIEADRQRREHELLLLLLLLLDEGTLHVNSAVRIGADPQAALRGVLLGSDRIRQPGLAPTLAEAQAEAYWAGVARAYRSAGLAKPEVTAEDIARAAEAYQPFAVQATQSLYTRMAQKIVEGLQAAEGKGTAATIREIRLAMNAGGFSRANPSGLELVSTQAVLRSYSDGQFNAYTHPDLSHLLIGYRHRSVMDSHTTPICIDRENLELPKDHPYWITGGWPPLHFNCRSVALPIFKGQPFQPSTSLPTVPVMSGFGAAPIRVWLGRVA